jgi:hypothetical protein
MDVVILCGGQGSRWASAFSYHAAVSRARDAVI